MKLAFPKTCNCCGKEYQALPTDKAARVRWQTEDRMGGAYWECQGTTAKGETCNSTLFVPAAKLETKENA